MPVHVVAMAGRILTGAPRASNLDWSEDVYLSASDVTPFIDSSRAKFGPDTSKFRSIGEFSDGVPSSHGLYQNPKPDIPALAIPPAHSSATDRVEDPVMIDTMTTVTVPEDMTLGALPCGNPENHFLSTSKAAKFVAGYEAFENKEYLEQSFMFYDLSLSPSFDSTTTDKTTQPSFTSNAESLKSNSATSQLPKIQLPSPIIDLRKLPNAAYINRIAPQTITVNLIAAVVNSAPPRNINLKQTNRKMDLVEMVVADETRTGFQISFWLHVDPEKRDPTRKALKELKPKDLVLLKNVALHVWNGTVFGQSLRKGWARTETTIATLARNGVWDIQRSEEITSAEEGKLQRVFDYAKQFLLARPVNEWDCELGGESTATFDLELPPETQS